MDKKNVQKIEPAFNPQKIHLERTALRVAAYARVSTLKDEQQNSLQAQQNYFCQYIHDHENWTFAGLFYDDGISGTQYKNRDGFNRMIALAKAGEIDFIVTKSVSRFARNTVDTLTVIREMKAIGVGIWFQKEDVNTLDAKGEFVLTLLSGFAQEESRSISENCVWGQRKRFADGKVTVPFGRFLGYDRGENGELLLNVEQSLVVRAIYAMFVFNMPIPAIVRELTVLGIPSPSGCERWHNSVIRSILRNEKYTGDAILQKSFTVNFLTKEKKKNEGELPKYYVSDNHEPVVSHEVFDYVQSRLAHEGRRSGVEEFSGKIVCGECGSFYGPRPWHSNDKYRHKVWQCKYLNQCSSPNLRDEILGRLYSKAIRQKLGDVERYIDIISETADALGLDSGRIAMFRNAIRDAIQNDSDTFSRKDCGIIIESVTVTKDGSALVRFIDGIFLGGTILLLNPVNS